MKNQRLAAMALAVAGTLSGVAHADPAGITLYGVLDAGVANVEHQGDYLDSLASTINPFSPVKGTSIKSTASVSGVANGGIQDSRWGLRGTEDLGDGLRAIFALESGIDLPTGQLNNNDSAVTGGGVNNAANSSLSGQLFNRQAWVGLSHESLGTLTVGRQYMPIYDILSQYDNVQFAQLFSPLSFSGGFGGGIGISESMREDSSVKYKNSVYGVTFGGLYRFGGISGQPGAKADWALNIGYDIGGFGIAAAYERLFDESKANAAVAASGAVTTGGAAVTVLAPNELSVQTFNSTGWLVALKYNFGDLAPLTLKGGISQYELTNGDLSAAQIGITTLYSNTISNAATSNQVLKPGSQAGTHIVWFGGDYSLTPKDNVSVGLYNISVGSAASYAGAADKGQASYSAKYYSALYDHSLSKRTDLYAGAMFAQFSDLGPNLQSAATYSSNRLLMLGMRTKF